MHTLPPTLATRKVKAMQALIVEDSDVMRVLLSAALEDLGFSVQLAGDVGSALRCLDKGGRPDLIVTDHNLPGASGLDFVAALRNGQASADVKVLMVSAEGHECFLRLALAAGVDEYLFKPFTIDAFVSKIALLGLDKPVEAGRP